MAWILHPKKTDPAASARSVLVQAEWLQPPRCVKVSQETPSRTGGSRGRSHRITQHEQYHPPGLQQKLLEYISHVIGKTQFIVTVIPNKPCPAGEFSLAFFPAAPFDKNRVKDTDPPRTKDLSSMSNPATLDLVPGCPRCPQRTKYRFKRSKYYDHSAGVFGLGLDE